MPRGIRSDTFHGLVALVLSLALTLGLFLLFRLQASWYSLLGCWLLAVSVITFGYYGYDKARAAASRSRIPEVVLHALALAGGTLGAYAGMRLFHHKTIKGTFRIVFWGIAVLQVALVVAALYRLWKEQG
jgi:uncharacterized membrane protein YsdA (DUF1294 family)